VARVDARHGGATGPADRDRCADEDDQVAEASEALIGRESRALLLCHEESLLVRHAIRSDRFHERAHAAVVTVAQRRDRGISRK
jgi:hypothetical protein